MSFGFLALNNNNQVLVSSDTRNLHFLSKPAVYAVDVQSDRYGGSVVYKYRVSSTVPIVPFFTMPTSDYYCITAIRSVGTNLWEIELVRSGTVAFTTTSSTVTIREPESGEYQNGGYNWYVVATQPDPAYITGYALTWDSVQTQFPDPGNTTSKAYGGSTYFRGAKYIDWTLQYDENNNPFYEAFYGIYRTTVTTITNTVADPTVNVPEVYVFADPRAFNPTDGYGMLVYRNDGTASFDSRISPLVVTGGFSVNPPSNPRNAAVPPLDAKNCSSNDVDAFTPDNYNTFYPTIPGTKPIYSFASLAQAQKEAAYYAGEEECDGFDTYGNCVGAKRLYTWNSRYWCFYRAGIKKTGASTVTCGWMAVEYGCNWDYSVDGSFIGIGTGGSSGTGGTWPYSNETLNLASTAVILADGSLYD